jgi:hypothetical protein
MYLTLLSEPRCRRCDGLVAHRLAIWPSVLLLFVLSGVQSAQNRQPLSGTVTTESGQPLSGVTIYGTSSKCCPYKREDSKTDKSGNFRIQHPGAVLHFFKDNLQPKTILLRPEESAIQITLLPASNNLNIPVCGKQVAGVKRIGWGEYGLKFDVTERRVRIPGGEPDVDYVRYVIKPKAGKSYLQLWFGAMAMSLEPEDEQFVKSDSLFIFYSPLCRPDRSGCDAQHDLAALMRRSSKHLVGNAGFFQGEHSPHVRNQFSAVEHF